MTILTSSNYGIAKHYLFEIGIKNHDSNLQATTLHKHFYLIQETHNLIPQATTLPNKMCTSHLLRNRTTKLLAILQSHTQTLTDRPCTRKHILKRQVKIHIKKLLIQDEASN
jgi:hypothetical protein